MSKRGAPEEAAILAESPTVGVTPDYDVPGGIAPDARDTIRLRPGDAGDITEDEPRDLGRPAGG